MTVAPRTDGLDIRFLLNELDTDEYFDLRKAPPADENERIDRLASSIEANGQKDDAIVILKPRKSDEEAQRYTIISGHRRLRALRRINEKRDAEKIELLKLRCKVEDATNNREALRSAIAINFQRADFTPMDKALLFQRVATEQGWDKEGFKGTKKVADFFNVDVATVTQHLRFLKAKPQIQTDLIEGRITAQGALEVLTVAPEKQAQVLEKAKEIQKTEDDSSKPSKPPSTAAEYKKAVMPESGAVVVKHPAVRKAIREEAPETVLPRKRGEIMDLFETFDSPAYGYPDGAVRTFITYFRTWAGGKGTDRTLIAKFDIMTDKAAKGTKESVKEDPIPEAKGKRQERKDAGTKKAPKPVKPVPVPVAKAKSPKKSVAA